LHALTLAFDQHLKNAAYLGMAFVGMSLTTRWRRPVDERAGTLRVLMYHRVNTRRVDGHTISPKAPATTP
jgi:hypothetical protein